MNYQTWFHQSLPNAVNRIFHMEFRKSGHAACYKTGNFSNGSQVAAAEAPSKSQSKLELFDDPAFLQELDRIIARIRVP